MKLTRNMIALVGVLFVSQPVSSDDFKSLFNGKDLSGWTKIGLKKEVWSVKNGQIIMQGEGGGWLGSNEEYSDFEFQTEFQLSSDSNSGIYLRAPADTSHISRTGMEIQLLDDFHPKYAKVQPWQRTGSIYHVAAAKTGFLKPVGEWNTIAIQAVGPHVVIKLNGQTVVDDLIDKHPELNKEHTGLARKSGRIGLQSHNGRVAFRNIQMKRLDSNLQSGK